MEKKSKNIEVYEFTNSEVLRALGLKIPKSKQVFITPTFEGIEIEISNN